MGLLPRIKLTCALLFFVGVTLFSVGIQFPRGHNFDEFHYVPAAKSLLEHRQLRNTEHPPLAKEIMAVGIAVLGDRPAGWRGMSVIFGALTLIAMYLWGLALFRDERTALWVALLTLVNHLLYVQARIGMLDTFMFCFLAFGMAAFTAALDSFRSRRELWLFFLAAGTCFGLATACKWYGLVAWAGCGAVAFGILFYSCVWLRLKRGFERTGLVESHAPVLWENLGFGVWLAGYVIVPVLVYSATFAPYFVFRDARPAWADLWSYQTQMWHGQQKVMGEHPYSSYWFEWPLLLRPIWYAFDKEGARQEFVRGVLLLGNPLVMWGGILAILACVWDGFVRGKREALVIFWTYAVFLFSWLAIPRKVHFYYYYYPAGMTLSLALAWFLPRNWLRWAFLAVAVGIFVAFFPILGALRIPIEEFRRWMWLRTWI